jgi:hypothetical protein
MTYYVDSKGVQHGNPNFTKRERRFIEAVQRRIVFLKERVNLRLETDGQVDYDKLECKALSWLIKEVIAGRKGTIMASPEDSV